MSRRLPNNSHIEYWDRPPGSRDTIENGENLDHPGFHYFPHTFKNNEELEKHWWSLPRAEFTSFKTNENGNIEIIKTSLLRAEKTKWSEMDKVLFRKFHHIKRKPIFADLLTNINVEHGPDEGATVEYNIVHTLKKTVDPNGEISYEYPVIDTYVTKLDKTISGEYKKGEYQSVLFVDAPLEGYRLFGYTHKKGTLINRRRLGNSETYPYDLFGHPLITQHTDHFDAAWNVDPSVRRFKETGETFHNAPRDTDFFIFDQYHNYKILKWPNQIGFFRRIHNRKSPPKTIHKRSREEMEKEDT